MVDIPFPTSSTTGGRPQESGGRLINAIVEKLSDGAQTQVVRKRAPGLLKMAEQTHTLVCRGLITVGSVVLAAFEDHLYSLTISGGTYTLTLLGSLPGDGPVVFARNNKAPTPDIVAVTSDNVAYQVFTGGAPIPYPDADVGSPNSVCFGDGYFFFTYGDGTCIASDLNDVTINPLNYTTAEAKPDGLNRAVFFRQELFLWGAGTGEVYQNTANPTGFPFNRSTVIPRGLISKTAIAGMEDGWSNTLIWVGDDNIVYKLNGYSPERISTHDLERLITTVAEEDDAASLFAFVTMADGHAYWALKHTNWCWVYDLTYGTWHERQSNERDTWQAQWSTKAFGQWLMGDDVSGALYSFRGSHAFEGTALLPWEVHSGQMSEFPTRVSVSRADFNFDMGVGLDTGTDPTQTDPRVEISWSDNGGATFSMPLQRTLGREGKFNNRVVVTRTGMTGPMGRVWRVRGTDGVYFGLLEGSMEAEIRTP